jgi:hypothetical protein
MTLRNLLRSLTLRRLFANKRGLGAPVGNLIILAAAVVLATTVVLYAVNVTTNQVQKESLYVAGSTVNMNQAIIDVLNTGPTSIRIAQVIIKGDRFTTYTSNPDISNGLTKGNSSQITIALTPNLITINDVGRPVTIVIATTQGSYFSETLIQAS